MPAQRQVERLPRRPETDGTGSGAVRRSIREIIRLEQRDRVTMGWSDRPAGRMTALSGSMLYVWLHVG